MNNTFVFSMAVYFEAHDTVTAVGKDIKTPTREYKRKNLKQFEL